MLYFNFDKRIIPYWIWKDPPLLSTDGRNGFANELMFTPRLSLLPGMFVRVKKSALDIDASDHLDYLPLIGQVADDSLPDARVRVRWWQTSDNGSHTLQYAEVPLISVARWIHPPNTPCMQATSHMHGHILCEERPTDSREVLRYFVKFDDCVRIVPETDLRVCLLYTSPSPRD